MTTNAGSNSKEATVGFNRTVNEQNKDKAARYAQVLYYQSLLIAGLTLEDPAAYAELVCSLME